MAVFLKNHSFCDFFNRKAQNKMAVNMDSLPLIQWSSKVLESLRVFKDFHNLLIDNCNL